jgi:hypothetical protein
MKKTQSRTLDEITPTADPHLDEIGRFLLRLAAMLHLIVDFLVEFGTLLIEYAQKTS